MNDFSLWPVMAGAAAFFVVGFSKYLEFAGPIADTDVYGVGPLGARVSGRPRGAVAPQSRRDAASRARLLAPASWSCHLLRSWVLAQWLLRAATCPAHIHVGSYMYPYTRT